MSKENNIKKEETAKKLTLFNLFQNKSKWFFPFLGFLGIVNGLWGSALLLLINNKITSTPLPFFNEYDWVVYIVLIVVSFAIAASFQTYLIKLSHSFGIEMRLSIFEKVRFTKYEDYLELGEQRLRTALNDVNSLQIFPTIFLEAFNGAVMIIIGVSYLFYVDTLGAAMVLVIMVLLSGIYIYRNRKIEKALFTARKLGDVYHYNVIDFVRGFKEVKMSIKRSDNIFHKHIKANRMSFLKLQVSALVKSLGNQLMGSYAWYILIGIVLFLLPMIFNMSLAISTSFLVTLLFLMGPVNTVIGLMEAFISMSIAIERLNHFNDIVSAKAALDRGHGDLTNINEAFLNIRFEDITYEYFDQNDVQTFKLQPLNLEIKKGESVFVTGGNGSGKSTFINILSGLYTPKSGQIYLNDYLITEDNVPFYRDQLACIFTDNYLFNENYDDLDLSPSNTTFVSLLEKMKLTDVVKFDEKNNKVLHSLSKGQQKRMALIYAIMEGKDVFVFDEWAAEQDPEFRKYFYHTIIPELKMMGKTVIAVTHDDTYFNCAERIIKFNYGEVVEDKIVEAYSY